MLFNYTEHPGKTRWASNTLAFVGRFLLALRYKVTYEYPDDLKQLQGPVLIISKHSHEIDIPLGYPAMLKAYGRHAWCIMKASLTKPMFMGFFWKIGGIPLDRDNPEKSKESLMFARKILYERDESGRNPGNGNMLVLFPEQTTCWGYMGEGKTAGFRFITGKPPQPLACNCVGFIFEPGRFRTKVTIRFGPTSYYSKEDDPAVFLDARMREIAELSEMEYPFPVPQPRKARAKTPA